ncbi:MAG TPA: aspartyl protease family protein, partial [Sphingomicrobium sp.]|nr:aspartyl protease family protein [Sphingomicrobium sp.]
MAPVDPRLTTADQLYLAGKFAEAETSYESLVKNDPQLVPARVGLVRVLLKQQKIDEALDSVNQALATQPNSAALRAVAGNVHFRRGEMSDAEVSYLTAKKLDAKEVHAYLGLARLYASYSLYRRAYDQLQSAHQIAPDDIEVQRAWLNMLPRKARLAALEAYLAGPHPDDEEETKWMSESLEFLRATADQPVHRCRLASKVERTEVKMEFVHAADGRSVRGTGLPVKLNDRNAHLLLDTGAGGIMVSRKVAEKAALTPISARFYGGIGDQGLQSGYAAVADHIRIGELEFEDCTVSVSDKNSVGDEDGLIGADVFGAYLVDLDILGMQLKLSPLPKRPEDAVPATSLNSEGEEQAHADEKNAAVEPRPNKQPSSVPPKLPVLLPRDRYVAPEMANWTKVFRFGHGLLVPTSVNDSKPMLFILDTGGFSNALSLRAGRQVSKVSSDSRLRIRGLNGEVKNVYSSAKVTLRFAHFQQANLDIVTLDLSSLSRRMGTEVSGFLGFDMLRMLEVKLDYRDGLVDFVYDPKR